VQYIVVYFGAALGAVLGRLWRHLGSVFWLLLAFVCAHPSQRARTLADQRFRRKL